MSSHTISTENAEATGVPVIMDENSKHRWNLMRDSSGQVLYFNEVTHQTVDTLPDGHTLKDSSLDIPVATFDMLAEDCKIHHAVVADDSKEQEREVVATLPSNNATINSTVHLIENEETIGSNDANEAESVVVKPEENGRTTHVNNFEKTMSSKEIVELDGRTNALSILNSTLEDLALDSSLLMNDRALRSPEISDICSSSDDWLENKGYGRESYEISKEAKEIIEKELNMPWEESLTLNESDEKIIKRLNEFKEAIDLKERSFANAIQMRFVKVKYELSRFKLQLLEDLASIQNLQ